jgi:hypothetical protein
LTRHGRNRSQGWRHAKLDGHANENEFANELVSDESIKSEIERYFWKKGLLTNFSVSVDGAKQVRSIFGDLTVSKVDIIMTKSEQDPLNISLKKSENGQVWLISVPRFIAAMEFHLGMKTSREVRTGISLFIGGANLAEFQSQFEEALSQSFRDSPRIAIQEQRQKRLVAQTIKQNFPTIWNSTIEFFNQNLPLITRLAFSQGLAESSEDAANVLIYNKASQGQRVFPVVALVDAVTNLIPSRPVAPGPKNGGSTLLFPTGFLQMHHPQGENQMQFHHQYRKILSLKPTSLSKSELL